MVITGILGGLGNQLSAYACGYSVAKYLGQELVLEVSDYTHKGYFRPYCLDKLQIGPLRKLVYPPASAGFLSVDCIPEELKEQGVRIVRHEDCPTRADLLAAVEGGGECLSAGLRRNALLHTGGPRGNQKTVPAEDTIACCGAVQGKSCPGI